jgi:hypothetical protein
MGVEIVASTAVSNIRAREQRLLNDAVGYKNCMASW